MAQRAALPRCKEIWCVTAGVPCQDVSIAGRRAGLAGKRTGLFYEFARVLREIRPCWFIFENVPGLLSSNGGRDFAEVLRVLMVECGYGVSWRVLDSQFFGVAQRRRRLFVVGRFGKPCPAEILFDAEGGGGDFAESGEAGQDVAAPLTSGSGVTGNDPGRRREDDQNLAYCLREDPGGIGQGHNTTFVSAPIDGSFAKGGSGKSDFPVGIVASSLRESDGHHGRSSPRGDGCDNLVAATLPACRRLQTDGNRDNLQVVGTLPAHSESYNGRDEEQGLLIAMPITGHSGWREEDRDTYIAGTLGEKNRGDDLDRSGAFVGAAVDSHGVRDIAGLPEGLDSPRYRALGNAVTVQVIEWIGKRLVAYEND